TDFEHASKWMVEKGYSFDFFSDRQLQKISFAKNALLSGGNTYQTILLPANKLISEKTMQKLFDLARAGATVLVYKDMPGEVPGFGQLESRRKLLQQLTAALNFTDEGKVKKATVGKGAFYVSNDLDDLLAASKARKESLSDKGLQFIRRKNADGISYFINNRTEKVFDGWVPLHGAIQSVALFDALTGKSGLAKWRSAGNGTVEVWLQLQPHESIVAQTFTTKKAGAAYAYYEAGKPQEIKGTWTVEFLDGGPVLPAKKTADKLESWTEFGGDDVKNFSGTARYTTSFQKPSGNAAGFVLDLGKVHETAEVFLNGKKLTTLIGPVFQTTIPSSLLKQTNTLEIVVANLMANRISYMDRNNIPWKIFYNTNMPARRRENAKNGIFDASGWKPLPSGLLGPVTLTPVSHAK
ncbi:MAG TPA: glycosyl hydrolase, partial [Flavisolibacter sp.]|nr:glycosyl hydrolase [Flavisolibacter sp.]